MNYLPSKKFIVTVGASLIVVFSGYFAFQIWKNGKTAQDLQKTAPANSHNSLSFVDAYADANRDSDGDGLKDWEEILWKTDPHNSDTDGDGTPDGEEVKEGRNPAIAGHKLPDGSWSDAIKNIEQQKQTTNSKPQTATDKIANEFAIQYLATIGASSGKPDAFQKQAIADSLTESISKDALLYKDQFSESDIKILKNADANFTKKYLDATGNFLYGTFQSIQTPELEILNSALASGNYDNLKILDKYVSAYGKTVAFLRGEQVPEEYAALHAELMNVIQNTKTADSFMKTTETDPAKGLTGIFLYQKQFERGAKFYFDIANKIKSDGISFSADEGGYHLVNVLK